MKYKKIIKKRNKLINDIKESFIENLDDTYLIDYMNVSEYYKDEALNILLKYKEYEIMFYVHIDLINLKLMKTIFEYSIYNGTETIFRDEVRYFDLVGNYLNEKILNLRNLWEEKIAS